MWSTFNYLSNSKDISGFMGVVNSVLIDGGILIIDMKNYSRLPKVSYRRESENKYYLMKLAITKNAINQVYESIYEYDIVDLKTGKKRHLKDQELAQIYSVEDIQSFTSPQFSLLETYGDYQINVPFDPTISDRIIVALKR
jgi:hypothetical protein